MRRIAMSVAVIVAAVVATMWYKLRSAEEPAPEPQVIVRPVSLEKPAEKPRQPAVTRDRPSRDRSARPGEHY